MPLYSYFKWCGVTAERGIVVEFGEESNAQPIDNAWRCRQGLCFLKSRSQEGWWQKFLSEETFPYFLIHSYCDFLTEYWKPGWGGHSLLFHLFAQGDKYFTPARWCQGQTFPGAAHERAELGREQWGQGVGHPKNQLKGLVCLPVTPWRRSWGLEGVRTLIKTGSPENFFCSP